MRNIFYAFRWLSFLRIQHEARVELTATRMLKATMLLSCLVSCRSNFGFWTIVLLLLSFSESTLYGQVELLLQHFRLYWHKCFGWGHNNYFIRCNVLNIFLSWNKIDIRLVDLDRMFYGVWNSRRLGRIYLYHPREEDMCKKEEIQDNRKFYTE